jgi:hypothetical protein
MRLTYEDFAQHLSVSVRQVNNWHSRPEIVPQANVQRILDGALDSASDRVKAQFALLVGEKNGNATSTTEVLSIPLDAMTSREWTRDDAHLLSRSFDAALERS